jgi:hypothetical protein
VAPGELFLLVAYPNRQDCIEHDMFELAIGLNGDGIEQLCPIISLDD